MSDKNLKLNGLYKQEKIDDKYRTSVVLDIKEGRKLRKLAKENNTTNAEVLRYALSQLFLQTNIDLKKDQN